LCPLAQFAWSVFRELFSVDWAPSSFADIFAIFQRYKGASRRLLWTIFAAQSWALWVTRNKFTNEARFPKHPTNCIFKSIIFLQLWKPLQKPKEVHLLDEALARLRSIYNNAASS
jgi:hypothetical protein